MKLEHVSTRWNRSDRANLAKGQEGTAGRIQHTAKVPDEALGQIRLSPSGFAKGINPWGGHPLRQAACAMHHIALRVLPGGLPRRRANRAGSSWSKYALKVIFLAALAVGFGLASQPGAAEEPANLGVFRDWQAMTYQEGDGKTCYVLSQPTVKMGKVKGRKQVAVMVSHFPGGGARDQVSVILGFQPAGDKPVLAKIGKQNFKLGEIEDGRAWIKSASGDTAMIQAMRRADQMSIQSVTEKGQKVEDTYSLMGFTKAYLSIGKACPK
jgi:Invasion associated locus B (IalB) protein